MDYKIRFTPPENSGKPHKTHTDEIKEYFELLDETAGACFDFVMLLSESAYKLPEKEQNILEATAQVIDLMNDARVATRQLMIDDDFYNSLSKIDKLDPQAGGIYADKQTREKDLQEIKKELEALKEKGREYDPYIF